MSDTSSSPVIARMLRPGRGTRPGGVSEARAWALSLPRVSEKAVGLVAGVEGHESGVTDLERILSGWDDSALTMSLAGPEGARGLIVLSAEALAALLEVQTIGRVSNRALEPRTPTPVDAALAGHVLDAWLQGMFEARHGAAAGIWRTTRLIADARSGKLALEDGVFLREKVHLALGNGARSGHVVLFLPELAAVPQATDCPSGHDGRQPVLEIEAQVEAILTRLTVPLDWFRTAGPDTLIPIEAAALGRMRLETDEGKLVTLGRLGRLGRNKAVRLGEGPGGPGTGRGGTAHGGAMQAPALENAPRDPEIGMETAAENTAAVGIQDKPDLPELPDLPDLPALPDLPEP